MILLNENEFKLKQQDAIKRMQEMSSQAKTYTNPPYSTPSVAQPQQNKTQSQNSSFSIPILDSLLKDGDATLIIGLLLLLMSEKGDKILLFALIYILL